MFYGLNGVKPFVDKTAFIHPQAVITGSVIIGKNVYVGPGAVLRGDWGSSLLKMVVICRKTAPSICFRE
jgi:phenylacetic acid degradation protein/carnitine operon protein CaiE